MPDDKPGDDNIAPVTGSTNETRSGDPPPKQPRPPEKSAPVAERPVIAEQPPRWKPSGDGPSMTASPHSAPPPPPKPPTDPKSYATIAADAFSDWTRQRVAKDCGCTSTYAVTGPIPGMFLNWKSDLQGNLPPWHRESTQPSGPTGAKTPTGYGGQPLGGLGPRSGVLPAFGMQRITYWREGIVQIMDLDIYTLTITVKCSGARPCPEGDTIVKTFSVGVGDREWSCRESFSIDLPVDMAGGMQASKQLPPLSMPPEAPYLSPAIPARP
jgi:hypothetical protein